MWYKDHFVESVVARKRLLIRSNANGATQLISDAFLLATNLRRGLWLVQIKCVGCALPGDWGINMQQPKVSKWDKFRAWTNEKPAFIS